MSKTSDDKGPFCIVIDWGTSSFRLWVLDEAGNVLTERRSSDGMMTARQKGFDKVFGDQVESLDPLYANLPVIIAGMAGAAQGWIEATYLETPTSLADLAFAAVQVPIDRDVRILPGIAQRSRSSPDVMRGEETQLLALNLEDGLVCIPGTHSKWVRIEAGRVKSFKTFMTGELFAVLSNHSILSHSVVEGQGTQADMRAFDDAVLKTRQNGHAMISGLFGLRAGQLLHGHSGDDNRLALSGLLIGSEIAAAKHDLGIDGDVVLLASGEIGDLYAKAFTAAHLRFQRQDAEGASMRGLYRAAGVIWGGVDD